MKLRVRETKRRKQGERQEKRGEMGEREKRQRVQERMRERKGKQGRNGKRGGERKDCMCTCERERKNLTEDIIGDLGSVEIKS